MNDYYTRKYIDPGEPVYNSGRVRQGQRGESDPNVIRENMAAGVCLMFTYNT